MKMRFLKRPIRVYIISLVSVLAVGMFLWFLFPQFYSGLNGKFENANIYKSQTVEKLLLETDSLQKYDINAALEKELKTEKLVKRKGMDSLLPKVYVIQGDIYSKRLEYPQALKQLLAAEIAFEQLLHQNREDISLKRDYAECLNKISEVYFHLERLDRALEYIGTSLKFYKEINDLQQIAKTTRNLGGIYFKEGRYEEALVAYLKVLEYSNSVDYKEDIQVLYLNIGATYLILERPEKSIEYFNLAEAEILKAINSDGKNNKLAKELSKVYYNKACYYYLIDNQNSYSTFLHKSLSVLDSIYAPAEADAPVLNLHRLYKEKGDFKMAYHYLLMYQDIKDSLFNIKNATRIHQLEKEHELYKNQRSYEIEKRETERQYWILLAAMLLVLLAILLYSNRQKRKIISAAKEKKKMTEIQSVLESEITAKEESLIKKEKEVKGLASKIVAKNQSLHSLRDHMDQIDRTLRNDINHKKIRDMIKSSRDTEEIENDRKKLLLNLEQISISMFEKLDADFGGLTKRQKQLAALVKQEFSAKEIAVLFNISHKAAQTGKYRLKKILKLDPDEDLESFLKKY